MYIRQHHSRQELFKAERHTSTFGGGSEHETFPIFSVNAKYIEAYFGGGGRDTKYTVLMIDCGLILSRSLDNQAISVLMKPSIFSSSSHNSVLPLSDKFVELQQPHQEHLK